MKLAALLKKHVQNRSTTVDVTEWLPAEKVPPVDNALTDHDHLTDKAAGMALLGNAVPEIIASLDFLIEGSESDFMLLGIGLRTVHANVTELTELMVGTVEGMGAGGKGGFLDRGRRILNDTMADIQTRQHEVKANLDRINALMSDIENLHVTSKQIKKFAKSLKTVALTMLVENARTIDSSVNIFSDVAQEIKDLSVDITDIANDVYRNVEKAREVHRVTREEIAAGIDQLESLTGQIRTTVQESTHDTEELVRYSIDTIEESGRRSKEISHQVAEIVVGVQFHDNMKQRIMNISNILNAVLSDLDAAKEPTPSESLPAKKTSASILRDLAVGLAEIDLELDAVYTKNKDALLKIQTEVDDLLQGLRPVTSRNKGSHSRANTFKHDPFSHLRAALAQLHDLLNRGETFYQQIQEAADQVADIAADLSKLLGIVRSISANTHNKAINSIIAANRQGEKGGALKLLAQAMNELATRSDGFSREVEAIITSIINAAGEISRKETRTSPSSAADNDAIAALETVMNDISLEYDNFRKNSQAAYERAGELKKATDTTLISLDFFKGLSQKIIEHRDRLSEMAGHPGMGGVLITADSTVGGHVPEKYTVEHQDNVILFEDAKRTIMDAGNGPDRNENFSSNVELF